MTHNSKVGEFMRRVQKSAKQPIIRFQQVGLWRWMAAGVVLVALWDGSGYFTRGNAAAGGKSFAILKEIPGGMHTHGAIMLSIAAGIIYASHDRPKLARRIFLFTWVYSLWISVSIIAGWFVEHSPQVVWSGPSKWFFVAWVALGLQSSVDKMKNSSAA